MNPTILFITHSECGGAERMTLLYAKTLQRRGYKCHLLVIRKRGMTFSLEPFIPNELPYDVLQSGRIGLPFRLIRNIMRFRPDYLFDSLPIMAMALSRMIYKRLFPKSKIVFRECNTPFAHTHIQSVLTRFSLRKADAVISQTEEMKREMERFYALPPERITVINNPVDASLIREYIKETYRFSESDYTHYIAVARIVPQKDYLTLLKAFAIVKKEYPKCRLHILGDYLRDRKYKQALDDTIRELGLVGDVVFEGFQSNPYKYIKAADVFVLSSIYEGLPNVMQEAMFIGKPVVATRCIPYISHVINDGINGYTVPTEDPAAFAAAMLRASSLHIRKKVAIPDNEKHIAEIASLFNDLWLK